MIGNSKVPAVQTYGQGLEGLVVGDTSICKIDGTHGKLWYRGYDVEELARNCCFESVSYLVLYGELPNDERLDAWRRELAYWRVPPQSALDALTRVPEAAHPLAKYRTMLTVAACEAQAVDASSDDLNWTRPARILSWSSSLAAAAIRHLDGEGPVQPRDDLTHAEAFLYQTLGHVPSEPETRAFEVSLIVQAEHGIHAAALAALTVSSTGADMGSAVLAGMGALSGIRHGGANQLAYEAMVPLADAAAARQWVRVGLERRTRFPGFGHRVYRCPDPRVRVLEPYAEALLRSHGLAERWDVYCALKKGVETALGSKGIFANVDGITGLIYGPLGLPSSAFPIPFCLAIQTGWMAHCLEYAPGGTMLEPGAVYVSAL